MKKRVVSVLLATAMIVQSMGTFGSVATVSAAPVEEDAQPKLEAVYHAPATVWADNDRKGDLSALPLGNGFVGAMVYGGVEEEIIQLNEHTIWSGGPGARADYNGGHDETPEANYEKLQRVRKELQNIMNDFTANSFAYFDDNGKLVTQNYPTIDENMAKPGATGGTEYLRSVARDIEFLKGNKNGFGSYQELGSIVIADLEPKSPVFVSAEATNIKVNEGQAENERVTSIFDGNKSSKWFTGAGGGSVVDPTQPVVVTAVYTSAVTFDTYTLTTGNDAPERDPKSWTLEAYNEELEEWYVIDIREDVSLPAGRRADMTFELAEVASTEKIRWSITKNNGAGNLGIQLSEFVMNAPADAEGPYQNYRRALNLDDSQVTVDYTQEGVNYHREYWINNPSNVMGMRYTADQEGGLTKEIRVKSQQRNISVSAEGNTITMTGSPSDQIAGIEHLKFAQQIRVINEGGTVEATPEGTIKITGADSFVILMTAGTNYQQSQDNSFDYFRDVEPADETLERVNAAEAKGYDQLLDEHRADYKELYDRVKLNIGTTEIPTKTTDVLIKEYGKTTTADEERYLETLYYQFGRYLLISSSRPGSLPANLQGIWADGLNPPWAADYHTNINVQMNYWLAEQTNLSESHLPMLEYIKAQVPRGTVTAQTYHGDVRGWTSYHENNIWGNTAPAVSGAFYFPAGGAWMSIDIWEAYAFSQDKAILDEYYDTLKGAALFWVDNLVVDERDGTLVSSPSWSPEHGSYSLGTTNDQGIIWDVFDKTIKAAEIMGDDSTEIAEIKASMAKLSGPRIGLGGQFQEWKDEITSDITGDGGHRHVNHLYLLHPANQIVAGRSEQEDKYVEAMKNTLNTRGDGGTGWSKAWKINFWARLRDGDRSHKLVQEILKESTINNLFDTHSPFQIDGNFGSTSGMTEMLLQSQGDAIELLPALSSAWGTGNVSGLKARGDVEVDMAWDYELLTDAVLKAGHGGELKVRGLSIGNSSLTDSTGTDVPYLKVDNNNITFTAVAGEAYTISDIKDEDGIEAARNTLTQLIKDAKDALAEKTTAYPYYDEDANAALEEAVASAEDIVEDSGATKVILLKSISNMNAAIALFGRQYNMTVSFGLASGVYTDKNTLTIKCESNIVNVRYTLNGSDPTKNSPEYTGALQLPEGKVVVKAAAFFNDELVGEIISDTYVIATTTNVARGSKVSGTNTISGYPVDRVIDGSYTTRWATNGSGVRTFTMELAKVTNVKTVVIHEFCELNQDARTTSLTMQAYVDGQWTEIGKYDKANPSDIFAQFLNKPTPDPAASNFSRIAICLPKVVETNQIRLLFHTGETSVWEIEVYDGTDAPIVDPEDPQDVPVSSVSFKNAGIPIIQCGSTLQLITEVAPSNATNQELTFTSSDDKVLTVDKNGLVTAIAPGAVRVTATSVNNQKAIINIVVEEIPVTSVTFSNTGIPTVKRGATLQLGTVIAPSNATNKTVTYLSSDADKLSVDENGIVKGIATGTFRITVTSANGKTAIINIRVIA